METTGTPQLSWDWGSAYDFFVSLHVLHQPEKFGLPGAWASGVRSRVPADERSLLEAGEKLIHFPLSWIYHLPGPKDPATALWTLSRIPVKERLPALAISPDTPPAAAKTFLEVAGRGSWNEQDLETLRSAYQPRITLARPKNLAEVLDWWARPSEFGEGYLAALTSYYQFFFAEEEQRICPVLEEALAQAQELAGKRSVPALLEELSQGVRFASLSEISELVLVPSYWSTPLVVYSRVSRESMVLLFGARPVDVSLVPGEAVADSLLRGLKALGDPTRLRILRHLADRPHTPAQLARLLRLRAPTVIHHLNALRLAGLVQVTLEAGGERHYGARPDAVQGIYNHLQEFLLDEARRDKPPVEPDNEGRE